MDLFLAILVDATGVCYSMYFPGICSKVMFVFALIVYLCRGARRIVKEHNATIKNKKLEEELNAKVERLITQINQQQQSIATDTENLAKLKHNGGIGH